MGTGYLKRQEYATHNEYGQRNDAINNPDDWWFYWIERGASSRAAMYIRELYTEARKGISREAVYKHEDFNLALQARYPETGEAQLVGSCGSCGYPSYMTETGWPLHKVIVCGRGCGWKENYNQKESGQSEG